MRALSLAAVIAASLMIAACSGEAQPPPSPPPGPNASATAVPSCRLPAPLKSEDACTTDADCGPSDPCHAHACVAKAKSRPKAADTMCTMVMDCASVDVNRCGCFEGRCALVPPP